MNRISRRQPFKPAMLSFAGVLATLLVSFTTIADETQKPAAKSGQGDTKGNETSPDDPAARVSVSVARDRARLMHQIYTTTMDVMHDRYFHADRAVVPARAMEDVFENLEKETGTKANWISVNLKAMSIDHDPETKFEKQAVRELSSGKPELELVEDGYYRRASPIPLNGGCAGCHAGFSPQPSTKKFLAGLIISIPVTEEK